MQSAYRSWIDRGSILEWFTVDFQGVSWLFHEGGGMHSVDAEDHREKAEKTGEERESPGQHRDRDDEHQVHRDLTTKPRARYNVDTGRCIPGCDPSSLVLSLRQEDPPHSSTVSLPMDPSIFNDWFPFPSFFRFWNEWIDLSLTAGIVLGLSNRIVSFDFLACKIQLHAWIKQTSNHLLLVSFSMLRIFICLLPSIFHAKIKESDSTREIKISKWRIFQWEHCKIRCFMFLKQIWNQRNNITELLKGNSPQKVRRFKDRQDESIRNTL